MNEPTRHGTSGGPPLLVGPPEGSLRERVGIPYPWRIAATWPLLHLRPSMRNPDGFVSLGPASGDVARTTGPRLAFLGDVMPRSGDGGLDVDPEIRRRVEAADLAFVNCEAPLGTTVRDRGRRFSTTEGAFVRALDAFGASPERAVVSVANNHAEDHGTAGLEETVARLEALGCTVVGARRGREDSPMVVAVAGGRRLGIIAWTHWRNHPVRGAAVRPWGPRDVLEIDWPSRVAGGEVDAVLGFPHWDLEFRHVPRRETRALARELAERGFALLVGHHAHVVQGAERVGEGMVFYSCGNAVSNAFCARSWSGRLGVLVEVCPGPAGAPPEAIEHAVHPFAVTAGRGRLAIRRLPACDDAAVPRGMRWQRRFDRIYPPTGGGARHRTGPGRGTPPAAGRDSR